MLRILILASLLTSLSATAQDLKILSLNFNSETTKIDRSGELREARFKAILRYVHEKSPDIIFLQEGWNFRKDASVAETLAREIGYDVNYRVGMGLPFFFFDSNAVLAKKEFKMSEEREIKLPYSAGQIGGGKNSIIVLGRISYAVGARLQLADGKPLYVYTTHLVAKLKEERKDQLQTLHHEIENQAKDDRIDPSEVRTIIGGDFNLDYDTSGIHFLKSEGYEDAISVAHPAFQGCSFCGDPAGKHFNPFTIVAHQIPAQTNPIDERDDWVFAKGPHHQISGASFVFDEPYDGVWMSDHFGIQAKISFDSTPKAPTFDPLYSNAQSSPQGSVVSVTDAEWSSNQLSDFPQSEIPVISPRGLVVTNASHQSFGVTIKGPGKILTDSGIKLNAGESSAFVFTLPGKYRLELRAHGRKTLEADLLVAL